MPYQLKSELKVGDSYNGAKVEAVGTMMALVYYGQNNMRVVPDRPIFCTENDILLRIDCIHRCGTDVKILNNGRAELDEALVQELQAAADANGVYDTILSKELGRVLGHEMCGSVVSVGSNVRNLKEPRGYTVQLGELPLEYLDFKEGERVTIQTRIASYEQPDRTLFDFLGIEFDSSVRGVQLLGQDIANVAMSMDGGYAQLLRLTPEVIQSGSIIRVKGISDIEAALIEPAACLLDGFDKATHPIGQGKHGNILKKGVKYAGNTAVIGSGSMGLMSVEMALEEDIEMPVGGAKIVTLFVRSEAKAKLARDMFEDYSYRLRVVVYDEKMSHDEIIKKGIADFGTEFSFDDVIVAAGSDAEPIELAHKLPLNTGYQIICFAGTRGPATIESGVWHYGNAGTSGTSGCNTRAMENVLGMIQRKSLKLEKYSGEQYTFDDLETNVRKFFDDKHLRPRFIPNEGTEPVVLETADGESLVQGTSK